MLGRSRNLSAAAQRRVQQLQGQKQTVMRTKDQLKQLRRATAKWQEYLNELEKELQTAGDDAQLANVDLQNMMQKQQQTLQQLSNISKVLHDTAMSIVRKIGG